MPAAEKNHLEDAIFNFVSGMQLYHKAITYKLMGIAMHDSGYRVFLLFLSLYLIFVESMDFLLLILTYLNQQL